MNKKMLVVLCYLSSTLCLAQSDSTQNSFQAEVARLTGGQSKTNILDLVNQTQPAPANCTTPWGTTIASGTSVLGYIQSTASNSCAPYSQTRACLNGILSGSAAFSGCNVLTPPVPPTPTPWYITNSGSYTLSIPSESSFQSGAITVNSAGTYSGFWSVTQCLFGGAFYTYNGKNCLYGGSWYPSSTTGVTIVKTTFNFLGSVSAAGQLSGTWSGSNGSSGGMSGSPSAPLLAGQFTNSSGSIGNWVAR
jgi:hypothetical protein